jgi:hypothetical protein
MTVRLAMLTLVAVLTSEAQTNVALEQAATQFKDRKLCFIGKLLAYTGQDHQIVASTNQIVRGMAFQVLWSHRGAPSNVWLHICGEPLSARQPLGNTGGVFVATLEGVREFDDSSRTNWPECWQAYKLTKIQIEPGGAANGSLPFVH